MNAARTLRNHLPETGFYEMSVKLLKASNPAVTRAAKKKQNRIIGLICPFLPPRVFIKYPAIRKIDGRGGGDRKDNPFLEATHFTVLLSEPILGSTE